MYHFQSNPKVANFEPGTKAHELSLAFAANYTDMLVTMHEVFNGAPTKMMQSVGKMYALRAMAVELMQMQDPRPGSPAGVGIGPPWEYVAATSLFAARGGRAR